MLSIKKESSLKGFIVTDGEGAEVREWAGKMIVCVDPSCPCTDVTVELYPYAGETNVAAWSKPELVFGMNVYERSRLKTSAQLDRRSRDLAKRFMEGPADEHWDVLMKLFSELKESQSEADGIDGAALTYPLERIEGGYLIGYDEIFPFGAGLQLEKSDVPIIIQDFYCLNPECACPDAGLDVMAMSADFRHGKAMYGIFIDYDAKKWDFTKTGGQIPLTHKALREAVEAELPDFYDRLKRRHARLRDLYRAYRTAKGTAARHREGEKAGVVSRNAPCPCGSGKKYKRCCGRDKP